MNVFRNRERVREREGEKKGERERNEQTNNFMSHNDESFVMFDVAC